MGFDSFLNPFSSKTTIVSVNVGARFLKLTLLKRVPSGLELADFSIEDLSNIPEDERDAAIKEKVDAFIKDRYVFEGGGCLVLNNDVSFSRRINMPSMPMNELKQALAWEMRDALPFPAEEAMIDFQIIKEVKDAEGVKSVDLIFMAAQRSKIYDLVSIFGQTTVTAESINIIPGSIANVFTYANLEGDLSTAVIEFSYKYTTICIFRDKELIFTRILLLGYDDIINSMLAAVSTDSGVAHFSSADAGKILNEYGIAPADQTIKAGDATLDSGRFRSMIRPILENLSKEIKNSFLHLTERLQEPIVNKVYLCGVGAQLKDIESFFKEHLDIDTQIFPLENAVSLGEDIPEQKKHDLPLLVSTIGGAMWTEKTANFLPFELRKKKREIIAKIAFRVGVIAVVAGFFLAYVFVSLRQLDYSRRFKLMQLHKSALVSLRESKDQIDKMQEVISVIRTGRVDGILILKELSNLTPQNVLLEEIDYSEPSREVRLSGIVNVEAQAANLVISEYIKILENSPVFESASLVSSSSEEGDKDNPLLKFRLKCLVEPPISYVPVE